MTQPPPIPLEEAQGRLLDGVQPLSQEIVSASQGAGRYLAGPLLARRTQPAADLSAMDGYAMRADDVTGPWQVVGESAAGHPFTRLLERGQAVRVSTGALMPGHGGAVLLQENARREGDGLMLNSGGDPTPRHIRRAGFDFRKGDELLEAGALLSPARIALAISAGFSEMAVVSRPSVAILDNGDELAADPASAAIHQIPASNGAMLEAMARPLASRIERIGPVPDRLELMLAALERARSADVVVTSGGASVGDHDLVRPALEEWGAELDFWRIAMKPGKPLLVAWRGEQVILGLPGNPVSSYVTAFLFLLPLLRKLAGAALPLPITAQMPLGVDLPSTGSRLEFVRARQVGGMVVPVAEQDSSALRALAGSNALIRREIHAAAAAPGEMANVHLLENGGIA